MIFRHGALITLVVALLCGEQAMAQSAPTFTGPRAELTAGWDQLRFNLADAGSSGHAKSDGLTYGGALGYDYAVSPNVIIGGEVSLTNANVNLDYTDALTASSLRGRRDIGVAARLGTKVTDNAILYAKVGYSNLQVRNDSTLAAGAVTDNYRDLSGLVTGAGAEVALSKRYYLKTEYDHSSYEDHVSENKILTGFGIRF
jgi:outer membrane immunogenic protein